MTTDDYVWLLQEQMPDGEWATIDQADDEPDAEKLLSRAENCFNGLAYRLYRSDWEDSEPPTS